MCCKYTEENRIHTPSCCCTLGCVHEVTERLRISCLTDISTYLLSAHVQKVTAALNNSWSHKSGPKCSASETQFL